VNSRSISRRATVPISLHGASTAIWDYEARVLEGVVWVLEEGSVIGGIIVLLPATDYLLLDNIAVSPARQGSGMINLVWRLTPQWRIFNGRMR
jgi:hypothetical protein